MSAIRRQSLDFRTKLFMTLVISYTLLLGNLQQKYLPVAIAATLLPYMLLLSERRYKEAAKGILFIAAASVIQKYFLYHATGLLNSFFLFIAMLFLRMLPGLMMGKYTLVSTGMSDMVLSLKRIRFPDAIVIPITVMARFFYTVQEDYGQIQDAMYLQGLTAKRLMLHPLKLFEYRTVPLLMCLTRTAEEVSISALTRGMEVGIQRSSISEARIKGMDIFFFLLMFVLIGFYIRGKYA